MGHLLQQRNTPLQYDRPLCCKGQGHIFAMAISSVELQI